MPLTSSVGCQNRERCSPSRGTPVEGLRTTSKNYPLLLKDLMCVNKQCLYVLLSVTIYEVKKYRRFQDAEWLSHSDSLLAYTVFLCLKEGKCRYSIRGRAGYCLGFRILPARNEKALQQTVANIGPVSVGINAMLPSFHHYRGGKTATATVQH